MHQTKKLVGLAMAAMTVAAVSATQPTYAKAKVGMEKCYGVAKKGMNQCGGPGTGHACGAQSTKDGDPNDWILVPTGTCKLIVNGDVVPAYKK